MIRHSVKRGGGLFGVCLAHGVIIQEDDNGMAPQLLRVLWPPFAGTCAVCAADRIKAEAVQIVGVFLALGDEYLIVGERTSYVE